MVMVVVFMTVLMIMVVMMFMNMSVLKFFTGRIVMFVIVVMMFIMMMVMLMHVFILFNAQRNYASMCTGDSALDAALEVISHIRDPQ